MNKISMILPAALLLTMGAVTACGATQPTNASKEAVSKSVPVTVTDDTGHKVTLAKVPQHIASVTEGTDEILSALVPIDRIAMVTTYASDKAYSNITAFVKGIPAIANANAEQIIAVKPDLVLLASYTPPGVAKQIQQANIPVYEITNFNTIADIEHDIRVVGQLVGNEQKATQLNDQLNSELKDVLQAVKGQKKVTVLDYSSFGFVAGTQTTVNDIIIDAGGINAAAQVQGWQKVTDEEVVKLNPDVMIDAANDQGFVQKIMTNPALQTVNAVKHHRVYVVNGGDLSSMSQYVIRGVRDVAHVLYPSVPNLQ